jgi:hypothetical protein
MIDLLSTNDRAVERALVTLFARQTPSEQSSRCTQDHNSRGFGALDAEIFSSFAMQVNRGRKLSPAQLKVCRKLGKSGTIRIGRYWKQLLEEVEAKGGKVDMKLPARPKKETDVQVQQNVEDFESAEAENLAQEIAGWEQVKAAEREVAQQWGEW